jgi:hypothetical protein
MSVDLAEIESRLTRLRKEWLVNPEKRDIILYQAKALQRARELLLERRNRPAGEDAAEQAERIFR